MLENTHGIDVGDRMYLLRMHGDRNAYELVQCRDLRDEAREALRSEADRLAAQPAPAAPAAPQAASPPPLDANGVSPIQGDSGACKRPRGKAPKGKVWRDGWVDERNVQRSAHTPATQGTLKVRPMGKAPKGKRWDDVAGCWTAAGKGCCKRMAPEVPVDTENVPPRARQRQRLRGDM
eukprot:852012-Prymnesium_polylepis.1